MTMKNEPDKKVEQEITLCTPKTIDSTIKIRSDVISDREERASFIYIGNKKNIITLQGEWSIESVLQRDIIKLLCFLDISQNNIGKENKESSETIFRIENTNLNLVQTIIYYYINKNNQLSSLFSYLRKQEGYWLIKYILDEYSDDGIPMANNIGQKYGVSETHFRRLCNKHLGHCSKNIFIRLRATNALLSIINTSYNFTDIANNHGYCSASHFSKEIKQLFGKTPKEFRILQGLFYEKNT